MLQVLLCSTLVFEMLSCIFMLLTSCQYASGEISSIMLWDLDKEQLLNSIPSSSDCSISSLVSFFSSFFCHFLAFPKVNVNPLLCSNIWIHREFAGDCKYGKNGMVLFEMLYVGCACLWIRCDSFHDPMSFC